MSPWLVVPRVAGAAAGESTKASGNPVPSSPEYESHPLRRVYRVTAYCDRGLTAAGVPAGVGQCAAPADIPFGSIIYIPDLDRRFVVTDRTARRFRHNTVDLFMPRRDDCLDFGRQYLECHVYTPRERLKYGSPRLHASIALVRKAD
ncbi:MAG: hypothetical protein D6744_02650 [Planctomycetota bacterium]|nr:MAG: hypothetical protein D6744_02650 [Planctomycetota bacterium]